MAECGFEAHARKRCLLTRGSENRRFEVFLFRIFIKPTFGANREVLHKAKIQLSSVLHLERESQTGFALCP